MADLNIRVFKAGSQEPDKTVTIPGGVLKIAILCSVPYRRA